MLSNIRDEIIHLNKRQVLSHVFNLAVVVTSAFMLWKILIIYTHCPTPVLVVRTGSMEPAFHRGDILFVTNYKDDPILVGDMLVFQLENREIPAVHRVIKVHEKSDKSVKILTKGDNNDYDDIGLYPPGKLWLYWKDTIGRVRGFIPYFGILTIYMSEYPKIKFIFLACLAVYALLQRD